MFKKTSQRTKFSSESVVVNPQLATQNASSFIMSNDISCKCHDVFLDTDIEEPQVYRELITLLFDANEGDTFTIYINSNGGQLDSALAIIEGIKHTAAHVSAVIIGACHSAASIISMFCHEVAVLDSAYSMIHTASFGSSGSAGNVKAHSDFTVKMVDKVLTDAYEGFLNKEEMQRIRSGAELWLSADEIRSRMEARAKFISSKLKKLAKEDQK
jgi:ATP-dependent protease ClpP protease subunit